MAKWNIDPTVLYSPSSGETIATAWQKQINISNDLLEYINRVRVMDASAGSNISDAEAFQLKVNTTDKTLLIRNSSNTDWIKCGYIDKNFWGIEPDTINAIKNNGGVNSIEVTTEEPSGGSNGAIAIDTNNKRLYQKINGVWTLLLSLTASDLIDYNNLIKNNDGDIRSIYIVNSEPTGGSSGDIAIDVTNKKMYIKDSYTWIMIFSLHASDLVDYKDIIIEEDVSTTAEANKIPRANSEGKLTNDITGSPDKLAGKKIITTNLLEGTTLVYRSSAGGFVFESVSPGSIINDTIISISTTYSSDKISNLIDELKEYVDSSGINVLKRNKFYNVGDIAYSTKITSTTHLASKLYLECIEAGTTNNSEPTLTNTNLNDEIIDGTAKFKIYDVGLQSLPIGSIYQSTIATSPEELFGGTWEEMPAGRVLLAQGTSNLGTFNAGSTGGEVNHVLSQGEMPVHNHGASTNWTGDHGHDIQSNKSIPAISSDRAGRINLIRMDNAASNTSYNTSSVLQDGLWMTTSGGHSHSVYIDNAGSGGGHNNMQPYIAVYMWKRTA